MGALIILGIIVVMFIIFIANIKPEVKKEQADSTSGKTPVDLKEEEVEQSEGDTIINYIKSFKGCVENWKKEGDLLEVDGELYPLRDIWVESCEYQRKYILRIKKLVFIETGFRSFERVSLYGYEDYKIRGFSLDSVNKLENLLSDCKVVKSTFFKLRKKFPHLLNGWYSVNNGEYYLEKGCDFDHEDYQQYNYDVYKFEDWSPVDISCTTFDIEELTSCENPKQTHWKHFLEIEMKAKKKREEDCHKFVDEVLSQQREYNDLQLQYEMMPSAPISDVVSFNNFCKVVSKWHGFKDYEIQNYLLLKQGGL